MSTIVEEFDDVQRIPYDSNIRDYWRLKEKEMPEFYEISQVLMSIPATQVSLKNIVILYLQLLK